MNYHKVLKKVEDQVRLFYLEHADPRRYYHTYYHIKEVVSAGSKMADHYQLDDRSRFIISAACCFHAAGYLITNAGSAEQKSAELAEKFLSTAGALQEDIVEIKKCIVATKMPQKPVTQVEKIVLRCQYVFFWNTRVY
jgi:predicted metal-dependent HD superfamily phosphohydrolase